MFTLVVVREPGKRSTFIVRDDASRQEVFRSYKRADAVAKQLELTKERKAAAA